MEDSGSLRPESEPSIDANLSLKKESIVQSSQHASPSSKEPYGNLVNDIKPLPLTAQEIDLINSVISLSPVANRELKKSEDEHATEALDLFFVERKGQNNGQSRQDVSLRPEQQLGDSVAGLPSPTFPLSRESSPLTYAVNSMSSTSSNGKMIERTLSPLFSEEAIEEASLFSSSGSPHSITGQDQDQDPGQDDDIFGDGSYPAGFAPLQKRPRKKVGPYDRARSGTSSSSGSGGCRSPLLPAYERSTVSYSLPEYVPDQEKEGFLKDLYAFMESKGTPITKMPSLGFKELDLYKLYKLVLQRGGMDEVTKNQSWKSVYLDLHIPTMSTSASYNTRTNYKKYLYLYELEFFSPPLSKREAAFAFELQEYVSIKSTVYQGAIYYAQILKRREHDGILQYYVHYNGWSSSHDEWMPEHALSTLTAEERVDPESLTNPAATRSSKSNYLIYDPSIGNPPNIKRKIPSSSPSAKKTKTDHSRSSGSVSSSSRERLTSSNESITGARHEILLDETDTASDSEDMESIIQFNAIMKQNNEGRQSKAMKKEWEYLTETSLWLSDDEKSDDDFTQQPLLCSPIRTRVRNTLDADEERKEAGRNKAKSPTISAPTGNSPSPILSGRPSPSEFHYHPSANMTLYAASTTDYAASLSAKSTSLVTPGLDDHGYYRDAHEPPSKEKVRKEKEVFDKIPLPKDYPPITRYNIHQTFDVEPFHGYTQGPFKSNARPLNAPVTPPMDMPLSPSWTSDEDLVLIPPESKSKKRSSTSSSDVTSMPEKKQTVESLYKDTVITGDGRTLTQVRDVVKALEERMDVIKTQYQRYALWLEDSKRYEKRDLIRKKPSKKAVS